MYDQHYAAYAEGSGSEFWILINFPSLFKQILEHYPKTDKDFFLHSNSYINTTNYSVIEHHNTSQDFFPKPINIHLCKSLYYNFRHIAKQCSKRIRRVKSVTKTKLLNPIWSQTNSQNKSLLILGVPSVHFPRNALPNFWTRLLVSHLNHVSSPSKSLCYYLKDSSYFVVVQ